MVSELRIGGSTFWAEGAEFRIQCFGLRLRGLKLEALGFRVWEQDEVIWEPHTSE